MKELQLNHTYLIRYGSNTDMLNSVTVLMITDKAYQLRYNIDQNSSSSWMQMDYFDRNYTVVEDISDFITQKTVNDFKEKIGKPEDLKFNITYMVDDKLVFNPHFIVDEICPTCGGSGQVHDCRTTAYWKPCPACNGSGKKSKRINLLFD
jgi:hypothetical protein